MSNMQWSRIYSVHWRTATIHIPELRHLDLSLPALYMTKVL